MVDPYKPLEIREFYRSLEELPKDIYFFGRMFDLAKKKAQEYLPIRKEDTCLKINPPQQLLPESNFAQYDDRSPEYLMWMTSIITMSWLVTNIKLKTEHGHCHNNIHEKTKNEKGHPLCPIGSKFHAEFYRDILSTLNDLRSYAEENLPQSLPDDRLG